MFFDRIANRVSAARRTSACRPVVEAVEARQHMDGSFGTAVALGSVSGLVVKLDHVNTTDNQNDYYKIQLAQAGRLRVTLDGTSGDADLYLYSAASLGSQIGSSTNGNVTEAIDKSSVPAGTYYARVNGQGSGQTNYTLAVQTDFAGQTAGTARVLGAVGTTEKVVKDFIGNTDKEDWYKFNTTANGVLNLKLDGLTNDVDVQLLASNGTTVLKTSAKAGSNPELIYHGTAAATYFVRVYKFNNTSNYTLHLKHAPVPADGAGNSLAGAKNLNTVGGTVTNNDWIVNKFDEADVYKFFVAEQGNINVKLSGLAADLKVELLDFQGNVTASSNVSGGSGDEVINKLSNFGGTYFVRVTQGSLAGANGPASPYKLDITAPKDGGPNTKALAKTLPFVNKQTSIDGFVGVNDKEDWYKVNVLAGKTLTGTISGLSADADLALYNSAGTLLATSIHAGTTTDSVAYAVTAGGDYYFKVYNFSNNEASYHFTATTT